MSIKNYLFMVLLFASTLKSKGQDYFKKYGEISMSELSIDKCSFDQNADAIVLFDIGKSYFVKNDNTYDVIFERITRIKILKESGIKFTNIEIPFYHEGDIYEKIYDLKGNTYNIENEKITTVEFNDENIYNETINKCWSKKKFALPNVKAGSIIEFKYKIKSQYLFNFRDWEFQWKIPVIYSEYMVKMNPLFEYIWLFQGALKMDVYKTYEDKGLPTQYGASAYGENSYSDIVYVFGMKNIPGFKDEDFITSISDYIIKIDFQLTTINHLDGSKTKIITTWEELSKELLKEERFGSYLKKSQRIAGTLFNKDSIMKLSDNDKFNYIVDFVKEKYSWNNEFDFLTSISAKTFNEEKRGNCADINLFTIGILKEFGIEAYPVILSTRKHGKIKFDYPFSHFFNYTVILVKIDGKTLLCDATEPNCQNNRLPIRCLNEKGLIINKDLIEWVKLDCSFDSKITTVYNHNLSQIQETFTKVQKVFSEYDALYERNEFESSEKYIEKLNNNSIVTIIDSTLKILNLNNKNKTLKISYDLIQKNDIINDKIYFNPFSHNISNINPYIENERNYPIDFIYTKSRVYIAEFNIPEYYKIEFYPENIRINNNLIELNYNVLINEDKINVSFSYNFKKALYEKEYYQDLKYYYNTICKKGNESLVLVKEK